MPSIQTKLQAAHDAVLSRDLLEGLINPSAPEHIRNIPELRHPLFLEIKQNYISGKISKDSAAYSALKLYYSIMDNICLKK